MKRNVLITYCDLTGRPRWPVDEAGWLTVGNLDISPEKASLNASEIQTAFIAKRDSDAAAVRQAQLDAQQKQRDAQIARQKELQAAPKPA